MTLSETISRMFGKNASSPAQRAVAGGAKDADSSPTDGQKMSGNYRKVHLRIDGLDISIENPKGSVRSGVSPDGKAWSNVLACDYGDIRGTEGVDGDPVDVYLADHPENGAVFVIDQVDPKTGRFDEHKVMYGFDSVDDAKRTYLACYQNGWKGLGWITPVTKAEFMKWLSSSDRKTKPFHEYKSVIPIVASIKVAGDGKITLSDGEFDDVLHVIDGLSDDDKSKIVGHGGTFRDLPDRLACRTVAYSGDDPVGFVDVYGVDDDGVVLPRASITLAVLDKMRGRGLAKVMTDDVMDKVIERVKKTRSETGIDKFRRFVWRLHKDNDSSARAAENSGFKETQFAKPHSFREFTKYVGCSEKSAGSSAYLTDGAKNSGQSNDDQNDGVPFGVKLRSFTDAPATRTAIMDNVLEAVKSRFPVEDDDVRLELADVKYEGPTSYTLEQQKAALLNNRRLGCGISGTWRLTDKRTGKVLDERRDGILRVPYYTDRGTIINNGSEYTVISQARLSPGVYVRRKQNGELESQFNVANGLGFRIGLNKETGALDMSVGQAHVPLYPILRAIGVKDDDIRKSWGDAVTTANVSRLDPRALDKVYARYAGRKADMNIPASEKAKFVSDALSGSGLDPDVVVRTLGIEGATGVTGNVILRAAQKLLNVNRGEEDPDERDNPRFSKFYGIEDMLRERIDKDSGRLTKSLLVRAKRDKSLARIGRNALSPYLDTFLSGSGLAMPGEEANPLSILTQMSRITRLGEGGISSPDLVTPEARNVQGDYLGYVDFISGPESFGIGIDVRAALGTMKGSDHRLYNRMVDMRTGKTRYVALDDAASHTVAFPGQDPKAPRLYAMRKGVPTMVPRDEVDFMVPGFGNTVSAGINMTPMPTAVQAGRQFYMSKFWEQYLPQKEGEVPLVDSLMDDGKTTYSEYYGRKVGCLTAPFSGTVVKANDKEIVVRGKDGRTHTASLVQGLPFNRMTQLSMFPQVKKGDEVQEGAILANSNFTDPKTGAMNMGRNLKVAVLPAPAGVSSYEDAIVISEDAAKKLATSRLYGYEQDTKNGVQVARNKYLAAFPKAYTKKQADTIDDSGVVKVGTVLNRDDPMILAIGPKMLSAEDAQLGKLSSVLRNSLTDKSQKWEHDWPGVVTDVVAGPHGVKVLVKSEPPVKVGDKLCYDEETEVLTSRGWLHFRDVTLDDNVATLDPDTFEFDYIKPSKVMAYDHDDKMYRVCANGIDLMVTTNHNMFVKERGDDAFRLRRADEIVGKRVKYKKDAKWIGVDMEWFTAPPYCGNAKASMSSFQGPRVKMDAFLALLGACISTETSPNRPEIRVRDTPSGIAHGLYDALRGSGMNAFIMDGDAVVLCGGMSSYVGKAFELGVRIPDFVFGLSSRQQNVLFRWMTWGQDETNVCFSTSSKELAGDFQRLCLHVGRPSSVSVSGGVYRVRSSMGGCTPTVNNGHSKGSDGIVRYSGRVYCCTMPKWNVIFVRRNGNVCWCGNSPENGLKGVVGGVLSMDKMPRDAVTNEPYDMLMNPMGFLSRVAPGQVMLMNLAKVAKKTGKQIRIPQTPPPEGWLAWTERQLAENGVKETADVFDPQTGRVIKGVGDGYAYVKAFHHLAEKKFSARGVDGAYTQDEQPAKGGEDGAKRMCFTADQVIRVIHGEESIGHIVDKRIPEYVWTRFDDGSWGYSLVTNWFCRKGRMSEVLSISVDYLPGADSCSRKRVVYTDKVMHVTRQHHMYAFYKGEVLAGDLKPGDWLTTYGYVPTDDQMSLLFGSMLGDGCICNVNDNLRTSDMTGDVNVGSLPFYQEQHSHHQYAYVNWKVHCLGALVSSRKSTQRKSKHGFRRADGEDKHVVYFQIHRHDIAERLKDMFYRQKDGTLGRKNLDNVDLSRINDVGIAAWFLDDGCASEHKKNGVYTGSPFGSISTLGFTYDENRKLAYWLGERLGTQVSIKTTHNVYGGVKKEYYYLALSADACRSMARIVARYVRPEDIPASKRWLIKEVSKYPDLYVGVDTSYALGSVPALVTSVRPYSDGKHGPDDEICLYDITVAKSHKYCASDCLVSNSGFDSLALLSHGATDVIKDSVTLRGSYNDEYWRRFRLGLPVDEPGVPFIYKKFINTLKAGGVNVVEKGDVTSIMPQTDADIDALANGRVIESSQMVDSDMEPVKGGLFDLGKTGGMGGNRWSMIVLPEAVPNPMMEEPVRRVLGLTSKRLEAILSGKEELNGETGGNAIRKALAGVNVDEAMERARNDVKTRRGSQRDDAVKVLGYLKAAKRMGISPADWMITRVPVLPPMFRPVSKVGDVALVPDMNELYKDIIEMKGNYEALSRELPASALTGERLAVYGAVKAAYGLGDPVTQEGRAKNLKGAIRQIIGTVPKTGMLQAKVISKTQDLVGRSVITPNRDLDMDQIGLPEDMAWTMFRPFVERKLVQRGYAPTAVRDMIDEKNPTARHILEDVMAERPVLMDRAPTWHKFNIMAFKPHIVKGRSIHVCPLSCSAMNADFDGNCVDFDSILTVRLSKSTLHKIAKVCYHEVSNKEKGYSMTAENTSIRIVGDDDIEMNVKIGMFPHMGEPRLDKNGAKVYKVPDGIRVLSVDPVTGARTFEPVTLFTHESGCGTVRVSYGSKSVIVSSNESLAVFDGASGRLVRVKPDESERRLTPVLVSSSDNFGSFGDRDLGWLFGSFISDGWISGNTVGYTKIEKAKRDEFVRILRDNHENFTVFEYSGKKGEGNKLGDSVKIHCNSRTLVDWMKQWKFVHEDSEAVPEKRTALFKMIDGGLIEGGSREFLWGMMSGLIDGDGSVVCNRVMNKPRYTFRINTSSKYLRDDVCRLCHKLGLRYSVSTVKARGWSNESYVVSPSTIDMASNLDMLTCIGETERGNIESMLASSLEFLDKSDMIPVSDSEYDSLRKMDGFKVGSPLYVTLMRTRKEGAMRGGRHHLIPFVDAMRKNESTSGLADRVSNSNTKWVPITSVEDAGSRDVFDLEVATTKTFVINDGVVVWDTVNIHVPASDKAAKQALDKMLPSKNLFSLTDMKSVRYKPEKEQVSGLWALTRGKTKRPTRYFRSKSEAIAAYRNGEIGPNDPVEISGN